MVFLNKTNENYFRYPLKSNCVLPKLAQVVITKEWKQ